MADVANIPGNMRGYLTPDQFTAAYQAVASEVEDAIRTWAAKSGMKEEYIRMSFEQARSDTETRVWDAPHAHRVGMPRTKRDVRHEV